MTDEQAFQEWGEYAPGEEGEGVAMDRAAFFGDIEHARTNQYEAELETNSGPALVHDTINSRHIFDPHNEFDKWLILNFKVGDLTTRERNLMHSVYVALKGEPK